jgi:hypothetical protein
MFALAGIIAPQLGYAAGPNDIQPTSTGCVAVDVALCEGGVLMGQVVDSQGAPQVGVPVRMLHQSNLVASVQSDEQGQFVISGLRAGVHQIETTGAGGVYRLWAAGTAPPAAQQAALVVSSQDVVRGQAGSGRYGPAIRGGIAGALLGAGLYWALDHNPTGS